MKKYRYRLVSLDSDFTCFADTENDCLLQVDGKSKHFQILYNKSGNIFKEYIYCN